jgi:hypothetical protein
VARIDAAWRLSHIGGPAASVSVFGDCNKEIRKAHRAWRYRFASVSMLRVQLFLAAYDVDGARPLRTRGDWRQTS